MLKTLFQKPDSRELIFALKCLLSASLALYIALKLGLPRPFWAPMATCIISQSMSAAVTVRGGARFIGTLFGLVASVILMISFINYTFLLCFLVALWVGGCMYFSMLKRTTDAYAYTVAGFTVPVIIYSIVGDANNITVQFVMDQAIARAEETGIGFFSAMIVHSIFLPQKMGPVVVKRLDLVWNDIQQWIQNVLTNDSSRDKSEISTAQIITELRLMTANLPFDVSNERWAVTNIRLLQDRLTLLIPLVSSIRNDISALRKTNKFSEYWEILLDNVIAWIKQKNTAPQSAQWLRERIKHGAPKISPLSSWEDTLAVNLATDLEKLITLCENCVDRRRAIDDSINGKSTTAPRTKPIPLVALHKDHQLALMVSASAVFAITLISLAWVISGWNAGFCAPMMTSIFYLSFVRNDNSVAALRIVLLYTIYSLPLAGVYLLVVLFSAHSFEMLIMLYAPTIFIVGIFMGRPKTGFPATIFMMNVWATTTMYDLDMANMTSFINGQVFAQCFGITVAWLSAMIFRSFDAAWTTKRLLNGVREEISDIAKSAKTPPVIQTTVKMVDRLSVIAPRLSGIQGDKENLISFLFREMRIGLNIVYLKNMRSRLERNNVNIQPLLKLLSDYFNKQTNAQNEKDILLQEIDYTLQTVCNMPSKIRQNAAVSALIGIRRDLFPEAKSYYPQIFLTKEAA